MGFQFCLACISAPIEEALLNPKELAVECCYSDYHAKADKEIARAIDDLCRDLRMTSDEEEADNIVARIARLRRSMSPIHMSE